MKQFEVGTRVAQDVNRWNPDEDDSKRGEVVGVDPKTKLLLVEVERWGGKTEIQKWNPETTLLETELETKLSQLEQEFTAVEKQVAEKVAEAAKLLNEASHIADSKGFELHQMYDAVSPLMGALRSGGWRTSALSC